MHRFRAMLLMFLMLGLLLNGCALPGQAQPTQAPIIIIASPLPQGNPPTAVPQPTAGQAQPTAAGQAAAPTQVANGPAPTVPAGSASKGTVTFAFDAFATYYPGIIIDVKKLLQARGYELKLVPFGLDADAPSEEERWAKLKSGEWDVLATTLDGLAKQSDPSIGAITAVIDESAGADKLVAKPEIATINDLKGKKIAFSQGSVGEYFLYYALSLAGLGPQDVMLAPQPRWPTPSRCTPTARLMLFRHGSQMCLMPRARVRKR